MGPGRHCAESYKESRSIAMRALDVAASHTTASAPPDAWTRSPNSAGATRLRDKNVESLDFKAAARAARHVHRQRRARSLCVPVRRRRLLHAELGTGCGELWGHDPNGTAC